MVTGPVSILCTQSQFMKNAQLRVHVPTHTGYITHMHSECNQSGNHN